MTNVKAFPVQSDGSHTSKATEAVNQVWDDKRECFFVLPPPEINV